MSRTQEGFHRDPSAINLASLGGGTPPPFDHCVGLNTPDRSKAPNNGSDQRNMGEPIKSPPPSNKECLAQSCGIGLFDIASLATTEYHGGHHGVSDLTITFIHNCGSQSFSNTVSLEDILICYRDIQQIHQKILQSWYNPRTLVASPSIESILDRGFQAFPKLRTLKVQNAFKFWDKFQELSRAYLLPLMLLEEEVPTELKVLLTLTGTLPSLLKHTAEDPAPGCLSRKRITKMIYFKL